MKITHSKPVPHHINQTVASSANLITMTDSNSHILYDISSPIQPRSYAPNPSKGRMALSFKGVPFKTDFVEIINISEVRKSLNCAATRKFSDGTTHYVSKKLEC